MPGGRLSEPVQSGGRTRVTEYYNHATLKLVPNCHLRDWLESVEDVGLNKAVLKKLTRDDLFLLLGFCFGFAPADEPIEQLDSDCMGSS